MHQIGGDPSLEKIVSIDESIFLHDNLGRQIWVVGAIDPESKDIRLDVINKRNQTNLKTFVYNHIIPGTHVVHDGWSSYTFLDYDDSLYTQEEHNHGADNFGHGLNSTSHIEGVWSWIKSKIKLLYRIIPYNHYIYFIKECEFRFMLSQLNNKQKEKFFCKILKYVYNLNSFNFYEGSEILDFDNYDY